MINQPIKFGLIGYPLGHSYSKAHFTRKFSREGLAGHSYENFEIESIGLLKTIILENKDLAGLNVTIPFKKEVMGYLNEIDPVALAVGAVNTIKITRTGNRCLLSGYNTDITGFTNSLGRWPVSAALKALVFGSGGSSLAVKYALRLKGVPFVSVSRKQGPGFIAYEAVSEELANECHLWINCTPVGMYPDILNKLPLPYQVLTPDHFLYDLVYNPDITGFLKMGIDAGASIMNGSSMLFEQAEASWKIWTGKPD
jgi:shikimate dehydrogenase